MEQMVCREELATMEPVGRTKVIETLLVRRVVRKSQKILDTWEACRRDWNQTLHIMTAHAMGAPRNSQAFEELAERVEYLTCLKERDSLRRVEALLLGTSGLLAKEYFDDYIISLQGEYEYLTAKYGLQGMNSGSWRRNGNFPASNPVLRIVQLAALVTKEEYSMDALMRIRTLAEVDNMLAIAPSDYWQKRFKIDGRSLSKGCGLGRDKVNMLAINLVAPMQFAYALVMGRGDLKDAALDLLEKVPAERNKLVGRWTGEGVPARSAYDTQALIELSYLCDKGGCEECPLAKMLKKR